MSKSYCNYTLLLLTHPVLDQKQSPEGVLWKRCSCEFCEISKNTFSYRKPLVATSVKSTLTLNLFLPSFIFRPNVGTFICLPLNICIQFKCRKIQNIETELRSSLFSANLCFMQFHAKMLTRKLCEYFPLNRFCFLFQQIEKTASWKMYRLSMRLLQQIKKSIVVNY